MFDLVVVCFLEDDIVESDEVVDCWCESDCVVGMNGVIYVVEYDVGDE